MTGSPLSRPTAFSASSVNIVEKYLVICASGIAIAGAVQDVRGGRIPNWPTYPGHSRSSGSEVPGVRMARLKGGLADS